MSELDYRLAHALNSVIGWIELGNRTEARAELEALPAACQCQPDVLELRWLLHAGDGDWEGGLRVADQLLQADPDNCAAWLHRAYALRRVAGGGLRRAAQVLQPAFEKFPGEPTIPFNLACYECQLGNLPEARRWLAAACDRGTQAVIKGMALADNDLEPLWPEIRKW